MKYHPKMISFFIAVTVLFLVNSPVYALDITRVAKGTVSFIKAGSIAILSDSNRAPIRVATDSRTTYDNVQRLSDLGSGDPVQIDYKTDHGQKIAVEVKKFEMTYPQVHAPI